MVVAVRVGLVGVAGLCVLMTGARRAGAASAERTFHVEYEASAACPGEVWFAEAVSSRAAGAQYVEEAEAAIRFRVELRAGTSALWVMLDEGRSRREFSGDSCADIAQAMVVVAAMVVEAEPADRLTTSDGVVSQTTPAVVSPPALEAPALAPIVAPPPLAARPPPAAAPASPTPRPENVAEPARWLLAVGAGLTTETAVASAPPFGGATGVELSWRRERRWGFASHLEALAMLPRTEKGNVGDAELRLAAGRGSMCGVRSFATLDLQPCLTVDVGALRAIGTGDQVSNATEQVMPWVAGGVALRTEYWLARSVALEAVLGARLLQRHDNFYLRPGSSVYRVPVGSFGLQFGIKFAVF